LLVSKPVSIEETLAWMCRTFENKGVSAETSAAKWYGGEEMDMEHAVWLMFAPGARGQADDERPLTGG